MSLFAQPGYADLNPSYDQPNNARPVWSLAKPLPRVVRPGIVSTKDELQQNLGNAQLPAENSQKLGLEVEPNDLEQGKIEKTADPRKMAAQVGDACSQCDNAFVNKIVSGDTGTIRLGSRMPRTSSARLRRPSNWEKKLSAVEEGGSQASDETPKRQPEYLSDDPLRTVPEEPELYLDEELDTKFEIPALDESTCPEDLHLLIQDLVGIGISVSIEICR